MTQQKARTHEESMDRHFDSGDGAGRRYGEHICGWARPRAFCRNRYLQWHRRLAIWTRIGAASARPAGPTGPTAAPAGMAGSDRTAEKEEGADSVLRAVRSLLFNESIVEASNPVPTPLLGHRCRSSQEITGSPTPFSTSNHYLRICPRASFSLSNPNIAA